VRVLLVLLIVSIASTAFAKDWPQPAAGESASGDIEVILTFDDGPNPTTTPQVLDILKARGVRAVFFLVGNMVNNENKKIPGIIERITREGHVIANHTQTHKDLCRTKLSDEAAAYDIDAGRASIERATGLTIQWFRAPYGARCERLERMLVERHIEHFHWDLDPQEWRHGNVEKTAKYVTGELSRAHDRVVLLMHDIKLVTPKALPVIFDWIDAENAKRAKSRKRKIRILSPSAYAIEKLPPGVADWFMEATYDFRQLPALLLGVLPTRTKSKK
jgi:peptidoglycan/xylan/chitin deacetylase (PgdA/CDA1 family)